MNDTDPFDPSKFRPYRPGRGEAGEPPAARPPGEMPPQPPSPPEPPPGEPFPGAAPGRRKWPDDIPVTGSEAVWPILAVWAVMIIAAWLLQRGLSAGQLSFVQPHFALVERILIIGLLYYLLYVRHVDGLVDGLHLKLGRVRWIVAGALFGAACCAGMWALHHHVLDRPFASGQGGDPVRLLSATVVCLVAVFVDELFYRGLIYPLVRRGVGVLLAVVIVTLWFGLLRGATGTQGARIDQWWLGSMIGLSLVLTLARVFSRNVGLPIAIHMGFSVVLCVAMWLSFVVGR